MVYVQRLAGRGTIAAALTAPAMKLEGAVSDFAPFVTCIECLTGNLALKYDLSG